MLIVCTKDKTIRGWAENGDSNASEWGKVHLLSPGNNKSKATQELEALIAQLGDTEALCIHAHGNDDEIGDEGSGDDDWGWTYKALANIFKSKKPGYKGNILFRSCGEGVDNFSSRLRVELEGLKALKGTWIYGQNRSQDIKRPYPKPEKLDKDVTLQAAEVKY